jgi:hypothetical protein
MKTITIIFWTAFIFGLLIPTASASLGVFKQGECISLYQFCDDCTYVNLTQIQYPNGTVLTINEAMTKNDVDYNYTFCSTNDLGNYYYTVKGNPDGVTDTERLKFEVTPSGQSGNSNIVFFIFIIVLIYGITFIGFFGRNIPVTILGGMAMMFLGVYLISQGIIIYRDNLTNYIAYLTLFTGVITSFWAIFEQFDIF